MFYRLNNTTSIVPKEILPDNLCFISRTFRAIEYKINWNHNIIIFTLPLSPSFSPSLLINRLIAILHKSTVVSFIWILNAHLKRPTVVLRNEFIDSVKEYLQRDTMINYENDLVACEFDLLQKVFMTPNSYSHLVWTCAKKK